MIAGGLIPSHYEHAAELVARDSNKGAKEARAFSPRGLARTKKRKRAQDARNGVELATMGKIDKKAANKRAKLAKREAKRRGLMAV
jgi:hypothetical protein